MNNMIRKLSSGASPRVTRRSDSEPGNPDCDPVTPESSGDPDKQLTIMHMRKTFTEFNKSQLNSTEYEIKLARILPLFSKCMSMFDPEELVTHFKEVTQFTSCITKLFVSEIRKRAANQSTEAAALAIIQFIEPPSSVSGESSRGWLLLSGLHFLLQSKDESVAEYSCRSALPSTLAKALYLFYDLPVMPNGNESMKQRRLVLHNTFVELLSTLCSHNCAGDELARKDDLSLLFSGASSWCPPHNIAWRKATASLLMIISSKILTPTVIKYIHSKGCIGQFVSNLDLLGGPNPSDAALSISECTEMIVCLFCILKDSAMTTPFLMKDFEEHDGYSFLQRFILQHEQDTSPETQDSLRNILLMLSTIVTSGYDELFPNPNTHDSSLYCLPCFSVPESQNRGCTVRNILAFQVLENIFISSRMGLVSCTVLDVISSIYSSDPANYFILEGQSTLAKFAEVIHTKDKSIQIKYFDMFEYIIFQLNYIPCKQFASLCLLLKNQESLDCSTVCMQSLFRMLSVSPIMKDVIRDFGILQILTNVWQNYLDRVLDKGLCDLSRSEHNLAYLTMDMLTMLVKGNVHNACLFRDIGALKSVQSALVSETVADWRPSLLQLLQQILMLPGGDEELTSLLCLLHTSPTEKHCFKVAVLKSLLCVLRESHRVRTCFRKVGGYLYIMSVVLSLEGALCSPPKPPWDKIKIVENNENVDNEMAILDLLHLLFKVLTISMRFEPANAKFFLSEVRFSSIKDSLCLMGAFTCINTINSEAPTLEMISNQNFNACRNVFDMSLDERNIPEDCPKHVMYSCFIIKLLYLMALDSFDKPSSKPMDKVLAEDTSLSIEAADGIIVHPGAVLIILELIPCFQMDSKHWEITTQLFIAEIVKSLVRSERNQQVMCEVGLPRKLFSIGRSVLCCGSHPLLPSFYYILERLSTQGMQPKELREFLRLENPLCCRSLDENAESNDNGGGPVSVSRVKALVSMMTPRDLHMASLCASPAFVEFDMSVEGFGCLFLPSIGSGSSSGNSSSGNTEAGGVGTGERAFPPLTGLTYSSWVYVHKYSDNKVDSHPIRLLTITRSVPYKQQSQQTPRRHSLMSAFGASSSSIDNEMTSPSTASPSSPLMDTLSLACLSIQISPIDHSLVIATHETDTPGADLDSDSAPNDCCARVTVAELKEERRWVHLAVVLNRAVLKQSSLSVYINGMIQYTSKLHYVIQNPGGGAATLAQATGVHATVGTPPGPLRKQSNLLWRIASTNLIEDALNAEVIAQVFQLGPNYTGSFQQATLPDGTRLSTLIPEERLSFGIHAQANSQLTLARLRKIYNKNDCRAVAKYLGISTHENATPIRILHNCVGHLNGPVRSLGAVLIGYLGMRTFTPQPVSRLLEAVGGVSSILGLIAMATDSEGLYASLKALLCALRSNKNIVKNMKDMKGFQTVAVLLKDKSNLLNSHILHLVFALAGTLDAARDTTLIPNQMPFEDLLCDLHIWKDAPAELQRLLYEHFYELITESGQFKRNLQIVRQSGLLPRLLFRLSSDPGLLRSTKDIMFNLLAAILQPLPDNNSLLKFCQYIASTMLNSVGGGKEREYPFDVRDMQAQLFAEIDDQNLDMALYNVYCRNRCLNILLNTLLHTSAALNIQLCDQLVKVVGFDWVFSLLTSKSHPATVWTALRILMALLSYPQFMQKFGEGSGAGGWLAEAESVVQNRAGMVLGFSVSAHGGSVGSACDINPEICHFPGFLALQHLLPEHYENADCYLALLSLLVGQPAKDLHHVESFDIDSIWTHVFALPQGLNIADALSQVELCPDAVLPILAMIRQCLKQSSQADPMSRQLAYPQTVFDMLTFLYQNTPEFQNYCMAPTLVHNLVLTMFSVENTFADEQNDRFSTEEFVLVPPRRLSPPQHAVSSLLDNPARRCVIEFLKNILVDSMQMPVQAKGDTVIDVILDSIPDNCPKYEAHCFVTCLMETTMQHLIACDILLGGQNAQLNNSNCLANFSTIAGNVFYFASRTVDCLWNGLYDGHSENVFDFLLKLLIQLKRKSGPGVPVDAVLLCVNRCILYMLSRPVDSIQSQLALVENLHRIASQRATVFQNSNGDPEFVACLAHLLFMLSVKPEYEKSIEDTEKTEQQKKLMEGSILCANASNRVWDELYLAKKQMLEDRFKTSLVAEMNAARSLVGDSASRCWQNFVDMEMRGPSRDLGQIQQQLQSKIQKMATGISRLASKKTLAARVSASSMLTGALGTAPNPSTSINSSSSGRNSLTPTTLKLWMNVHLSLVKELVSLQASQYKQWHEHVEKWVLDEWHSVEQELIRERGLWGPERGSKYNKWMLDSTEGPCRKRCKLIGNSLFYIQYPFRPTLDVPENKTLRSKVAISRDSRFYYELMKSRRARTMDSRIIDTTNVIATPLDDKSFIFKDMKDVNTSMIRRASIVKHSSMEQKSEEDTQSLDENAEPGTPDNHKLFNPPSPPEKDDLSEKRSDPSSGTIALPSMVQEQGPDNQTLLRLLEEGEELQSMFRCARIHGLDTREGLLLFGKDHYYVVDGYTLLKTREIRDLDFLPEDLHDPIVPYTATGTIRIRGLKRICNKFAYEDIKEVHKRRYLLQPIALEVFSSDGRNYLLAFPKKTRNRVHAKFLSVAKLQDSGVNSVSGQSSGVAVEQGSNIFSALIGETSVTQRWVRGEMSNFQYLMHLNTLAGRSYNDLSQYPVFPWVLNDYDSEELDLTNPDSFRDLSKSMGAQTRDRLEQFMKRYREWDDPSGETPPYMYGTHYSSAMIVVSYLVRIEPFTQQFLQLQGGHFDLADRMFHSMREAWYSASKNNMADVKELIPEFYYLPEFLNNDNNFDLGVKQSGAMLNNVVLPPWAKGDSREFIRIHREALECDFVSSHLHEWIDLIFGYKQQGQSAIDAQNLFHHLFYEGNVDIELIDDPLTRNATIGFINNFGQIPTQLFKKPHPCKKLPPSATFGKLAGGCLAPLTDPLLPTPGVTTERLFYHCFDALKPPSVSIKDLKCEVGVIVQNEKGQVVAVEQNKVLLPPTFNKYLAWGFADRSIRLGNVDSEKSWCIYELSDCGDIVCAACPNNRTVVTGSTNSVVSIWELSNVTSRTASAVGLVLRKCLYGHTEAVSCLAASAAFGLVVSGSRDASCIVWDLSKLTFIRQLGQHFGPVSAVAINEATGDIGTSSGTYLYLWTINGQLLASINTAASPKQDSKQMIFTVAFSTLNEWDPQHVIMTGSNDGIIRVYSLEYTQIKEEEVSHGLHGAPTPQSAPAAVNSQVENKFFNPEILQQRLLQQQARLFRRGTSLDTPSTMTPRMWSLSTSPNEPDSGLGTPLASKCLELQKTNSSDDSFVMLHRENCARPNNRLRPGFKWWRQLVFRSKLSMHTAFDRKDNPAPAPITAIAPSKDHKTLYSGDGRGRVWSWVAGEPSTGARADHWVQDTARSTCTHCHQKFSLAERKHHCRNCGHIFCSKCSRFESDIKNMKISRPVRVCQNCFVRLKSESLDLEKP